MLLISNFYFNFFTFTCISWVKSDTKIKALSHLIICAGVVFCLTSPIGLWTISSKPQICHCGRLGFYGARSDHIWTIWCICRWQALLCLYTDWTWVTNRGKAVIVTSQSHLAVTRFTLETPDVPVQIEHHAVLKQTNKNLQCMKERV